MRGAIATLVVIVLVTLHTVLGDVYLHYPRGSNNKLRAEDGNGNRLNNNRLFDSQNNAKGGYLVGVNSATGDTPRGPEYYFDGSLVYVHWTNQHTCGTGDTIHNHCEIVLQYMCTNGNKQYNGQAWTLNDGADDNNGDTGTHEPASWYTKCTKRQRNMGLWIADRNLGNVNQQQAVRTRQNNNGAQSGNECPEERDYYPYWHPSPWKDIAVFTDNLDRCDLYKTKSQNIEAKGECECTTWATTGCADTTPCWTFNNETSCKTNGACTWVTKTHSTVFKGGIAAEDQLGAPECLATPYTRDNHLGDTYNGTNPSYVWKIPPPQQACGADSCSSCVFRIRYNITTGDFDNLDSTQFVFPTTLVNKPDFTTNEPNYGKDSWNLDYRANGATTIKMGFPKTVGLNSNNEVVDMGVGEGLQLAYNTAQTGRTFEDRSHTFMIKPRPAAYPAGATIHNVNVRGRRGNIVQAYPAVEYDFVPTRLTLYDDEYVHLQWTGSNTYRNGLNGQGQDGTDRSNFMEIESASVNFPRPVNKWKVIDYAANKNALISFATSGKGTTADSKLNNATPYFDGFSALGKLIQLKEGEYHYMSSRNNNFTNRSQKGHWIVKKASERPQA